MHILLIPSAFYPSVGGVEELTRRLGLQLRAQGHQVEILTSRTAGDRLPVRDLVDGLPVVRSPFPAPRGEAVALLRWPWLAVREFASLLKYVRVARPDVLHVQCFSSNGAYALALSRVTGIPLVITLHGETVMDDHDIFEHSTFLRTALRLGLHSAAAVTACSQFTLNDAENRFRLPRGKGSVIFNGVDLQETETVPVEIPFSRFVLAFGRIVHKKGFDLLLRAWARTCKEQPEVGLVIAGTGPSERDLVELTAELGIAARVHFPGLLSRGQVASATAACEVLVMPSRVEPFGIVALEGWRGGAAVVVTSHGGAAEFVKHDVDGVVVDPMDEAALAAELHELLGNELRRRRLAQAGRERVRDFAWPLVAHQYVRVYESAKNR